MRDEQKRPGANRPNPETLPQLDILHSTAIDAPAFVVRAFERWSLALDEALAHDVAPWPFAEVAAASIWREWHE